MEHSHVLLTYAESNSGSFYNPGQNILKNEEIH